MSFRSLAVLCVALPLALACAVQAQTTAPRAAPPAPESVRQGPPPDAGDGPDASDPGRFRGPPPPPTEALQRALGLSDVQAKALDGVMRRHREQMDALHQRSREQHDAIDRSTDAEVRKLLGEQRFAAFRQWLSQHRPPPPGLRGGEMGGPMGGRRGARDAGGPGGRGERGGRGEGGRGWGPPPDGRGGPEGPEDGRGPPPPPPAD